MLCKTETPFTRATVKRSICFPTILALAGLAAWSAPAPAMTGLGCPDLPAYARAQGTIQLGEGACNMTTAEAWRILARERPDLYGAMARPHPSARHRSQRHRAVD